jgi:hypothetical protein
MLATIWSPRPVSFGRATTLPDRQTDADDTQPAGAPQRAT